MRNAECGMRNAEWAELRSEYGSGFFSSSSPSRRHKVVSGLSVGVSKMESIRRFRVGDLVNNRKNIGESERVYLRKRQWRAGEIRGMEVEAIITVGWRQVTLSGRKLRQWKCCAGELGWWW
jgi:hypothetical protein